MWKITTVTTPVTEKTLKDEIFEETNKVNQVRFSNVFDVIREASSNGQYNVRVFVPPDDLDHFKTFFTNHGFYVKKMEFDWNTNHHEMKVFWDRPAN